jgi:hypothetical protein
MSIYGTLWKLKFPKEGDVVAGCEWIEVTAQGVPSHIGSTAPASGYDGKDPYGDFLPPPVEAEPVGDTDRLRAVVFVTEHTLKGTERSGQEYLSPLLVLTGEQYAEISFDELHNKLCDALRGNRAPVFAQLLGADGTHKVLRAFTRENQKKSTGS